jgi:tetratricopeptide (TPR) repeat protein
MLAENRKKFPTTQEGGSGMGGDAPYIPEAEQKSSRYGELASLKGETAEQSLPSKLCGAPHARTDPQGKEEAYLGEVLGASFNDLATAEALEQKYQQAFDHYREAARWSPKIPGLQRNLGLAAYFASKPDEAVRLLSKVVTEAPGDAQARAVLGLAYFASGKFAQTVKTLRPLGDRTTQDPELGFARAKSLAETGNKEEAKRALQNIGKEDAKLSVAQLIQFGELCRQLGQMEQAKQLFHRALTIEPDNAVAKCALQLGECP